MKFIYILLLVCLAGYGLFFLLGQALEKSERAECELIVKQASEIKDYYFTDWQVEMCAQYDIIIFN